MNRKSSWRSFIVAFGVALVGSGLALSCGGDDSGDASTSGGCSISGTKCQFACSPTLGCVECGGNSDCGAAQPFCVLGRCEACATNANCGTGQACYPRDHTCQAVCTATSCSGDTPICDATSGACVGCVTSKDCAGTNRPICSAKTGQCSECAANADCGAAQPVCSLRNGECVECLVDGDCHTGFMCNGDHHCQAACSSNADCTDPGRPFCNTATKGCVECLKPADCPAANPICSGENHCVQCAVNADCKNAAAPICKGDHCVQCESPADCITQPNCTNGGCKCKAQTCSP